MNPEKSLNVALFGAGQMAMHHARAISVQKHARLVAIADPMIDQIQPSSDVLAGTALYKDPEKLLLEIKPDIVHICTPPKSHYGLSMLALNHGSNIYVEKPFTLNLEEAQEIINYAKERNLKLCPGHQLLFEKPARELIKNLQLIGSIVHVISYFSFNPISGSKDGKSALSPLDQLIDILPHPVYLLLHFMKTDCGEKQSGFVKVKSIDVNTRGNVNSLIKFGDVSGTLTVTLEGRPIESYLKIIGTNGTMIADFVRGTNMVQAGPGTSGISKALNPYFCAWQLAWRTTVSLGKRLMKKQKSYPGLSEIFEAFYRTINNQAGDTVNEESILETVALCETITTRLKKYEEKENARAEKMQARAESKLEPVDASKGTVLVTGGTGFLGRAVAKGLRGRQWSTRVVSRKLPSPSRQIAGVHYVEADLAERIPEHIFDGVSMVIHLAAETAGGMEAHRRNSVETTRNLIQEMDKAGIGKLIYISSISVLKTYQETGSPVDENTPLVENGEERGAYIWGKVESEKLAVKMSKEAGIDLRVIRPGAILDYNEFEAPGKLGREVGPLFVCVGGRKSRMGTIDVNDAAKLISLFTEEFETMPPSLNLIEPFGPTHSVLLSYLKIRRPDLRSVYLPPMFLRIMSPAMKILQKILRPKAKPIDIYSVFAPEKYKTNLVEQVMKDTWTRSYSER